LFFAFELCFSDFVSDLAEFDKKKEKKTTNNKYTSIPQQATAW